LAQRGYSKSAAQLHNIHHSAQVELERPRGNESGMSALATTKQAYDSFELYEKWVNPQWVRLLDVLQMNTHYERCIGCELYTSDGRRILDFNSGYCVHNAGHNHPTIKAAVKDELDRDGAAMLQSNVSELAGELAARLCQRAGGRLTRAFFGSSGSEGVETVIKFARAHTGRSGLLSARGSFHGLTCGALSLMSDDFWKAGFGPLLPDIETVTFGDAAELADKLASRRFAAFIIEPIQVEGGVVIPSREYLLKAQELCRRFGTLLALDEVQTAFYRTGPFLSSGHFGVEPDMVVLAKAMSGGLIPVGAVLMTEAICDSVYSSLRRAIVHTSTYSENALAMRAGLASLEVFEQEKLGERAARLGDEFRRQLKERLSGFEMVRDVRGLGMLTGIEFQTPRRLRLRVPFEAFARIHPAMFGQILVMRLFRDHGMLTQICGNNFMVLKVAPPLIVSEPQLEEFVTSISAVVELMHNGGGFWSEALGLARRVITSI
jgi:ornithine--oxo-acid transaminase